MLEKLSLIASVISGLTAVTTSLRALGKSRETLREEMKSRIASGSCIGSGKTIKPSAGQHSLLIYLAVTLIWLSLSVIFCVPVIIQKWESATVVQLLLWFSPFALLGAILIITWWKVMHPGK